MDEIVTKDIRNLIQGSEHDLKASKNILRLSDAQDKEELACHLKHVLQKCERVLGLLALEKMQPARSEHDQPVLLDLDDTEGITLGRVTVTPNGVEPSKEVNDN